MSNLIINGGKKLKGNIINQTAKNSAVAILCACLLVKKGRTLLSDVPQIEEVNRILELLASIGVKIEKIGQNQLQVDASHELNMENMDKHACCVTRSSLMLIGALACRTAKYKLYKSGGCRLGQRTVRPHIFALSDFGVSINSKKSCYEIGNSPLRSADIVMYESGDTATENAIMTAVLSPGVSHIKMASANYMVQDLCYFLQKAGAKIQGIGTTNLTIEGVDSLDPVQDYSIMPDPIVAMTYLSVAIVTGSQLIVENCPLDFLELELYKLKVMGQKFEFKNKRLSKNGQFTIVDIEVIPSQLSALPDKIYGRPFPGLNIDNLPLFVPILTQAKGRTLVHDWAYENRSVYYLELVKLGANITMLDSHRVWVEGPTEFNPNNLKCPPALRLAINLLICMLAAGGKSVLRNTYPIDRGYEDLYHVLNSVGADITVKKSNTKS
ncbi:MAG: UDP-N-acetylglucosamine 1-carboxyvinyltransferase [bacterium]